MRKLVANVHCSRACLRLFYLHLNRGQNRQVSSEECRPQRVGSRVRVAGASHGVEDPVPPPIEPSSHSRWTERDRTWIGRSQTTSTDVHKKRKKRSKLCSTRVTMFFGDGCDRHQVACCGARVSLQLDFFGGAKRSFVESLGSVLSTLMNMKRALVRRNHRGQQRVKFGK